MRPGQGFGHCRCHVRLAIADRRAQGRAGKAAKALTSTSEKVSVRTDGKPNLAGAIDLPDKVIDLTVNVSESGVSLTFEPLYTGSDIFLKMDFGAALNRHYKIDPKQRADPGRRARNRVRRTRNAPGPVGSPCAGPGSVQRAPGRLAQDAPVSAPGRVAHGKHSPGIRGVACSCAA
jgi:hypothetical protein